MSSVWPWPGAPKVGIRTVQRIGLRQKHIITAALTFLEICEQMNVAGGKQVHVCIELNWKRDDAKVCSALCCDAPVKHVLKKGLLTLITYMWLCNHVVPNIAI